MKASIEEVPLAVSRRFAMQLLYRAQHAPTAEIIGTISGLPEAESLIEGTAAEALAEAVDPAQPGVAAIFLHRPQRPTMPEREDFQIRPDLPRLTTSLATKGVLQLRAWRLRQDAVEECALALRD